MGRKKKEENFIKVTEEAVDTDDAVKAMEAEVVEEVEEVDEAEEVDETDELIDDENFKTERNHCGSRKCFSYRDGYCYCLRDTDFKGRGCPFFKTRKQLEAEMKKMSAEKDAGSFDEFLEKNADCIKELAALDAEAARIEKGGVPAMSVSTGDQGSKEATVASVAADNDDDGWEDEEE